MNAFASFGKWKPALLGGVLLGTIASPATAQLTVDVDNSAADELIIAVPALPTPQNTETPAGGTADLGGKISDVIVSDLRSSGLFEPRGRNQVRGISFNEVTAPQFPYWSSTSAAALIQGFVRTNPDGKLTVGCY
ncbi:MAG: Tol-Pal system protein TolB, partial [Pseudomonadota bacterium]